MPYGNALPLTGGAGALFLGHLLGLDNIIEVAIIAVLFTICAYRFGSRIGRARKTIYAFAAAVVLGVADIAKIGGLSWLLSAAAGLTAAVLTLYLSSRLVPQERRVVA